MKINYRPEIDGLRAIAVIGVILYHTKITVLGYQPFKGGFIGVDIFFIITGFLITSILLFEHRQNKTINIINFYERRIRRLLPVLLFIIIIANIFSYFVIDPMKLRETSMSTLFSVFFAANIYFYYFGDFYGNNENLLKPLLHLWSLGVEEQFYILYPIFLTIILKFFRRYILFFIILGILISFSFAVYASIEHKHFSFYMLPSRAWEILIGSFLGYLYYKKKFEFNINYSVYYFLYIVCLIIILLSFFFIDIERFRHPSFITLIPLIATSIIIFIESSKNKGCLKILNNKYLVFVGKISYSLYLWHFLLFAIYRNSYLEENLTTKILIIFLSFLFSILTYKYIENVFRDKKITSKKKLTYYVIFSLSLIFLINLNNLDNKKNISKYEIDNVYLTQWKDSKEILTYIKKNNLKEFPINNKINVLIVGNCHADDTFVALKLNQNNFKNFNFIRYSRWQEVDNFISHTNSKLYKNADIIIISTLWNTRFDDLSSLPDLIKKIKQDKKKVVVFSTFPHFFPLHEKVHGWTKIQLTEYKKIIFEKKTTKLSDIELTNLRKKYYLEFNTKKEIINTNNKLKEISKQNNIKFINTELFLCNHEKKECLVRLDDFNEIYRNNSTHSMPGLKLMGSMISKDFFKKN